MLYFPMTDWSIFKEFLQKNITEIHNFFQQLIYDFDDYFFLKQIYEICDFLLKPLNELWILSCNRLTNLSLFFFTWLNGKFQWFLAAANLCLTFFFHYVLLKIFMIFPHSLHINSIFLCNCFMDFAIYFYLAHR